MIYVAGSLRNPAIPSVANHLIEALPKQHVFADWYAAGEKADDAWKAYEQEMGFTYREALGRPAARNVYAFDKWHIDQADAMVLVLPAGKSGHLELGYHLGKGRPGFILLEQGAEPRWDVMYQFATAVCDTLEELVDELKEHLA